MSRKIHRHNVEGVPSTISIDALGPLGPGGSHSAYEFTYQLPSGDIETVGIKFQSGPVVDGRVNGLTNEALLAIVEDRLQGFQEGPFGCDENQCALNHLRESIDFLRRRTLERIARGVEGKVVR